MDAQERERWQRIDALFEAALEQPEAARLAWLEQTCPDAGVRAQVLDLLRREQQDAGPLEALASALSQGLMLEGLRGRCLGGWTLQELLGEGGMATVWRASREVGGYTREAALKCLKLGLYSPELRQRFIDEQSILARLEHPHIARLYEAGIAEDGTPYIAMEQVRGLDLIAHADARRLDTGQRIALFLKVVDAVAHAHRELVVHRDLKPANILVDEHGAPRLLDFGIARLIEPGSGHVATTALRPHTPEYAAPEQLRGEPVGVRADVYALGLLLHELLCGERAPADPQQREQGGPSTRLRRSARREALAELRRRSATRLLRELRGDLDLIVQRCLWVEPGQRYPSAEALAEDLRRWQQQRPISARQGNRRYRFRRYLQRHWLPLSAAALVLLSLSAGIALALREAARADAEAALAHAAQVEAQRQAARAQSISGFVVGLFEADLPGRPRDEMPSTRELVDRGIAQARDAASGPADLRAELMLSLGQIVLARQQFDEARALSREARALLGESAAADPATWARALHLEADSFRKQRRYVDLKPALDEAIAFLEQRAPDDPQRFEMLRERGSLELFMENPDEAERRLTALRREIEGRTDLGNLPMRLSGDLANVYGMQGRMREAAAMHAEILAIKRATPDTPAASIATTVFNLGSAAFASGELLEARSRYEEALALMADIDAPLQVRAAALLGLARLEHALGHGDAALQRVGEAAQEWARNLALADPDEDFFGAYHGGRILADLGRVDAARERLSHAVSRMRASQDAPPARIAAAIARLAQLDCAGGAPARGSERLREARAGLTGASTEAIEEAEAACALAEGRAEAALELLQSRHPRPAAQADDPDFDRMRVELLLAESLQATGGEHAARVLAAELSARLDRIGAAPDHALRARLAALQRASD